MVPSRIVALIRLSLVGAAGLAALALASPLAAQGEIQKPRDTWQKPGEIQQPKGTWQQPGEIQISKGIQAIRTEDERCAKRFVVGADALFEFDKATLTLDADAAVVPEPASLATAALGLLMGLGYAWRRKRAGA